MKVFHIDSEKTFRGGQRQVLYLLEGLNGRGVENFLFCPRKSPLFERAGTVNKIAAPMLGEFDIFSAFKISRRINREKPDIIHCHSAHALALGLLAKKLSSVKPALVAARRADFHIRCLKKYQRADRIITVSKAIKQILISDGIDESNIDVVYSGIKDDIFSGLSGEYLYKDLGIKKEDFVIGNVAALTEQKDHITLLKAAEIVVRDHPNAKFIIVGSGKLMEVLKTFVLEKGLKNNIILTGFRKDVMNFYKIFDIFAISSKWEGLGTSILDAMLSGIAVTATCAGGIPEIIEDGSNGLISDTGDFRGLAAKIIVLIKNGDLRKRISAAGIETAKKFNIVKTVGGTLAVYEKILNERKK